MAFRDQVAAMDEQLLEVLGDEALIEGRDKPVPGFISVPWSQPKFGQIKTSIREPVFAVRIADAAGVVSGQSLIIDLPPEDGGGKYIIVKPEPDGTGWVNLVLREVR
ncbi:hypothetical protein DM813_25925 [Pseudomonas alkylphenolica]|uniref:Uncharacterized protein n=1 Tax=Pseudomonas alkylphenolica TaxID=237609 RepID=A0A443ZHD3_9PSED|nr:hypothetical protein [Pseudomonas alkylphenolica]RWU18104.1 hypothetical protein DM813_25925 [Pseudomonas alkylphenolica]